jgi:hypothetical protein
VQDPAVHKDVEGRLRIGRRRDGKVSWRHRALRLPIEHDIVFCCRDFEMCKAY